MKKTAQILALIVLMASACSKDPVQQIPPTTNHAISKIETGDAVVEATYNSDGSIQTLTRKYPNGANSLQYVFSYENGLLKEISFGAKWKYNYNGSRISSVETYNPSGVLRYITRFTYVNDKITEKKESLVNASGEFPSFNTKYEYNTDGNISRKEIFYYINNAWSKTEETQYVKYDNKINTGEHLENLPYMPLNYFSVNNPLRENYLDENGQPIGLAVHEYVYDVSNRPVSRKTTLSYIGFSDTLLTATYHY